MHWCGSRRIIICKFDQNRYGIISSQSQAGAVDMNYSEPEVITIIEGPPPDIRLSQELWSFSLWEGTAPRSMGVCQMRTFNGSSMMDRCTGAWREGRDVRLDF